MQKAVILTEEEYSELLKKANSNEISITKRAYNYLRACENTLFAYANPTRICPKCGTTMLVQGYVCFNCGYDDSVSEDEE